MECNSVVECCADNAEGVSSNLTIPIVAFGQHKTLMGCFKTTLEVWQRGLLQNPAKIPCLVIGTVGSNPTTSVRQCSSVVEQEIHTLYVGSSILPIVMCR